jgi:hypothetical protein
MVKPKIVKPKELVKVEEPAVDLEKRNPAEEVKYAIVAAKTLKDIIDNNKRKVLEIQGQQYLYFEDWQMLSRFFNYTVGTDWTKPIEKDGVVLGYEARATVYNKQGVSIGSAEASCFRTERNWASNPEFQVKSMAQTRACAKSLRNILAWVVVLAGYQPVSAEEMDNKEEVEEIKPLISEKDYAGIKELAIGIDKCKTAEQLNTTRKFLTDMDKKTLNKEQVMFLHDLVEGKMKELNMF